MTSPATVRHEVLARARRRPRAVRRVPARVQAARRPARRVLRARPGGRRGRAHDLRALERLLRRPDREEAAQPLPSRQRRCCRSAPPAATSPAASARTGTSRSRRRSTRSPTRRRRRRSPARRSELGCRSVAFTYNDPTIFLEYAIDVADACRAARHRARSRSPPATSAPKPARELYAHIDAANVDLKALHRGVLPPRVRRHTRPTCSTRSSTSCTRPTCGSRSRRC